jgi:F-type H+-transporting ATPase subunit gamma
MSGALLEIKKKIGSIQNTRKITKAMQLVAASKMRQFQKKAVSSREYVWSLFDVLESNLNTSETNLYSEERTEGKTLFILYTSDKGLCGGLNTKLINGLFRSKEWTDLKEDQRLLITVGKKSFDYANNNDIKVEKEFVGLPEKMTTLDSIKIVDEILKIWREDKVKEVFIVAPHYKNSFTFYPVMKSFLPFNKETIDSAVGHLEEHEKPERKPNDNLFMLFEPSEGEVLQSLHEQLVQSLFQQSFMELKASEYSSRMIAMQNATDSADRIVHELKLDYNKARQAVITNEIAELMGGSAAISTTGA